jgi:hypothetical protein
MGLTKPRAAQIYNLDYKQSTRVVTTTNITLAGGAPSQVDGVSLSLNNRVLVTGQSTASQNGLYYVTTVGSGSNGTWARTSDGNETGEIEAGMIVMVTEGTIYADTQWKLITDDPITIGTTALTFTQNYSANSIASGNSNVIVNSNANVTISSAGTANVLTISNTGAYVAGVVSATGNVTGNYILGNGSQLTGLPESYGNSNVAAYLPTYTGNLSPGNLTTGGLISATGNISGGNLRTAGLISATGGVTGNTLLAGGISLTGNAITSTNATITIDPNSAGGVDGAVIIAGNLSVQGNVTYIDSNVITTNEKSITLANNVNTGTAADGAGIDVGNNNLAFWRFNNATTSWQSNIGLTPAANASLNLGGTSNYWAAFYATSATVSGNISSGNLSATNLSGTLSTAAQTNITSVGTLTSLSVTGNTTSGNVLTGGLISATGNITGGNISATNHTGTTVSVTGTVTSASVVGGVMTGTSLSATGNVTGGNVSTGGLISATGNVVGNILNATSGLVLNSNTISANYTLPSNYNAMSAGPITIDNLGNVNVGNGQRWTIV